MEDVLILILQAFFELLLEIICNLPLYFWPDTSNFGQAPWSPRIPLSAGNLAPQHFDSPAWNCFWLLLIGGMAGGLSLAIFNHTFISVSFLRIANLIYAPVTSGFFAWFVALLREMEHPRRRFLYAFFFTFGLTLIRFTYAHH